MILLCLLGIVLAVLAHIGSKVAEGLARERYRELVGEDYALPKDGWEEIRPLAGRWGCLLAVLDFLRGLGVVVALGTGVYMIAG